MRSKLRIHSTLLALGLAAGAVGCADQAVGPREAVDAGPATAWLKRNAGARPGGVVTFVYDPRRAEAFKLRGGHRIFFPRRAVCDPAVSTYGVTEWDKPCVALRTPISITAQTFKDAAGRPYIDFSPSLRFVPGVEVVLSMNDPEAAENPASTINWCDANGECVDESVTQPELTTRHKAGKGVLERVIKHFSGYNVTAGRSATSEMY
jgi:hypothetical protein